MMEMQKIEDRIFVSTACLGGDKSHRRVIDTFLDLGIHNIELTGVHPHMEASDLEKLIQEYQAKKVNFTFHNYFPAPQECIVLNFLSRDAAVKKASEDLIKNAVSMAKKTNIDLYAFHPGYLRDAEVRADGSFAFFEQAKLSAEDAFQRFAAEFAKFYQAFDLEKGEQKFFIAIENLFPAADGEIDSFMCDFPELDRLFSTESFKNSNIGLLLDLGHLTISANVLGFDRNEYLQQVIGKYGDRIYEVHISENDTFDDLHLRVHDKSWQLDQLQHFQNTGNRIGGTKLCIESRRMKAEEIRNDYELVLSRLH